jgi:hypothetical protein
MNCTKCSVEAPTNIMAFPGTKWTCSACLSPPKATVLEELKSLYVSGMPGRFIYVSDFTGNLDKAQRFFIENLDMDNPHCIIYLTLPVGLVHLTNGFDGAYIERDAVSPTELAKIQMNEGAFLKWTDPSTMELVDA